MNRNQNTESKPLSSRKDLFKKALLGMTAFAAASLLPEKASAEKPGKKRRMKLGMVIDMHQCTGCGACEVACKVENNVPAGFRWAHHVSETAGTFPNVRYVHYPTLCNHCDNAPCVQKCPTRALYKDEETNLTKLDPDLCIGCTACGVACPYGAISFNRDTPHARWRSDDELIPGCTSSGEETVKKSGGNVIPFYNKDRETTFPGIRPRGIVEKCTFCDHRLKEGKQPYCVEVCPTNARLIGDFNDSQSAVSRLIAAVKPYRLKEELGTSPNVYYIRNFNLSGNRMK